MQHKKLARNWKLFYFLYLMATFIGEVGICRPWLRDASMLFLPVPFNWACSQNIIFFGPSYRYGSFWAFAICMPQLIDWICSFFGFCRRFVVIKKPFWVVIRPHLMKPNIPTTQNQNQQHTQPTQKKKKKICTRIRRLKRIKKYKPGFCGPSDKDDQKLAGERCEHSQ